MTRQIGHEFTRRNSAKGDLAGRRIRFKKKFVVKIFLPKRLVESDLTNAMNKEDPMKGSLRKGEKAKERKKQKVKEISRDLFLMGTVRAHY